MVKCVSAESPIALTLAHPFQQPQLFRLNRPVPDRLRIWVVPENSDSNSPHPNTRIVFREVRDSIDSRPPHRILVPDREIWREAGILAGLPARLQQSGKADQRRALNDALLLLSAAKAGLWVLTRNIEDFDLLQQLAPFANAAFCERI